MKKIEALRKVISALEETIKALKAKEKQINVVLDELNIKSLINGYVVDKVANEGEVIGAGMTVITAIDPENLYLKVYVDTLYTGKIKIGDKAEIFLDAYPDKPIPAIVVKVSKERNLLQKKLQ